MPDMARGSCRGARFDAGRAGGIRSLPLSGVAGLGLRPRSGEGGCGNQRRHCQAPLDWPMPGERLQIVSSLAGVRLCPGLPTSEPNAMKQVERSGHCGLTATFACSAARPSTQRCCAAPVAPGGLGRVGGEVFPAPRSVGEGPGCPQAVAACCVCGMARVGGTVPQRGGCVARCRCV